ncbi:MAG TPA: S9 family peptidase [Phycisphaerae bacterium]|nr:S9 family peptidase [Phycisphaerae bacterium]
MFALTLCGCAAPQIPEPPVATVRPHTTTLHGVTRTDDYYWLKDRTDPEVIRHLEAENAHTAAVMKHVEPLRKRLYKEFKSRLKETDLSVPARDDDYYYYTRTFEGKQYQVYCRKKGSLDAEEEVLLDANELAKGHEYFRIGGFENSPDHKLLAYSVDTNGSEMYTLRVKDLTTGRLLPDEIRDTYYGLEWGNDDRTLFYTTLDAAKRPYRVFRHRLGTDPSEDELVFDEPDERFYVRLSKSRSEKYILLSLDSKVTSEVHYLDADRPQSAFTVIQPRQHKMEYRVAHHGDRFFIVTNDDAVNFKLVEAPVRSPSKDHWTEVIPHRPAVKLDDVDAFADHLAVYERKDGLAQIAVRDLATGGQHYIEFPEPVYTATPGDNREFDSKVLRFNYTSLVTPASVFDYNMETHERELKKRQEVLGGYDPDRYQSERIYAIAPDGTRVPISLVYRKGITLDGTNPALLYGYGSYGMSMDPDFDSEVVSLWDRGFIYAIAHVRGGGEMGRPWYDSGKLLHKKNTFTDFIACAEHLIDAKYTAPDRLAIMGGSAGGLLMGAVVNMRPDLFQAVVAQVPFVDVVTTMLDPSIPLTVTEYEEWGNPNEQAYFEYILSYSPVDNVAARDYPHLLITAGLNDPRVGYWEPAKWAAKLRVAKTDHNRLLLKTEMGAGHGGKSGRYRQLEEDAFEYAFVLDAVGITE